MTYEEKRELRLQISQLLADAGLNQKTIKDIVEQEIKNKVDRAIDQVLNSLNSECYSGNYVKEQVIKQIESVYITQKYIKEAIKDEMKNRIFKVTFTNMEQDEIQSV